jgi:SHS family lactate transporter-like MFS transporter
VKESEAWRAQAVARKSWGAYFRDVAANWRRFLYLVIFMAMMNFMSHGTQDLYPTFLQHDLHFNTRATAIVSVISMIGAIAGGILVGLYSDRGGRRRAMVFAMLIGMVLIPLWVFAPRLIPAGTIAGEVALVSIGALLMQFMVQGAWGVVPAHINELSPGALRGFFPGFAYQLGVFIAAASSTVEAQLGKHFTLAQSMGMFAAIVFVFGAIVTAAGPEAHRVSFGAEPQ